MAGRTHSKREHTVTMRDVANAAGVSIKTVSNVVNDYEFVTEATRAKVREAIDRLGPRSLRLMFTTEGRKEAAAVLRAFAGRFLQGEETVLSGDYTRGHFKRGVE